MAKIHFLTVVLSTIFFSAKITNTNALGVHQKIQFSQPRGRLLTPEEGCGISNAANSKIVGGTKAKPGAFPWIALVGQTKIEGGSVVNSIKCGGALITSRHVLTAAHCATPYITYVTLGEHDLTTVVDGMHEDVGVIRIVKHSEYNPKDNTNDIAVLTLERDVIFTDRIRPICLPEEYQFDSYIGSNPFVAGWGYMNENGSRSDVLNQLQLPVIENELCEELYRKKDSVFSSIQFSEIVLCAGNLAGGQDTCQGDSGGPLMLPILTDGQFPMYQIGVVSYGMGCARENSPGVYTRVSNFTEWIKKQLN